MRTMPHARTTVGFLLSVPALAVWSLASLSAATDTLSATWRQQPITVDGKNDEWQQGLLRMQDVPASIGVMNDGQHLYLAIAVSDQAQRRRLMMTGLNIWLDKDGGKKKHFGIQIPRAGFGRGEFGAQPEEGGPPPDASGAPGSAPGSAAPPLPAAQATDGQTPAGASADRPDRTLPALTYFYVLGPDENDRRRVELDAHSGVELARGMSEGTLIYELKVPLSIVAATGDAPAYGLGATPGQKIGIGLESPKFERPGGGQAGRGGGRGPGGGGGGWGGGGGGGGMGGRGGGMGRGGMGGGGGMGRGGRGGQGGPGGPGGDVAKPMNAWATVVLAKAV